MLFVENIIPHLAAFLNEGERVALVTLVHVEGSAPRPPGSQIGVAADGRHVGMITGGCAEKAIAAEAVRSIRENENRLVRYGAGSAYVDVVLPCGSGVDLYFEVREAETIVRGVHDALSDRRASTLAIDVSALQSFLLKDKAGDNSLFLKQYDPDYQIFAFGEGTNLVTFCQLAAVAGFRVVAFSPDEDALAHLKGNGVGVRHIFRETDFSAIGFDRLTAVVTLFHEHEWEAPILHAALNSDADYIGALGSRATHALRLENLAALPATRQRVDVIHGPVGLHIGATGPSEIALSILSEITKFRRAGEE